MSKDSKRPKNKERPLPGSAHKYLERHNERLTELESVKSRKGEGMKGFKKRISEMRNSQI